MTERCHGCEQSLDTEHDKHYACPDCADPPIVLCPSCAPRNELCPACGARLDFHDESITRKAFFNPATRGGLGF